MITKAILAAILLGTSAQAVEPVSEAQSRAESAKLVLLDIRSQCAQHASLQSLSLPEPTVSVRHGKFDSRMRTTNGTCCIILRAADDMFCGVKPTAYDGPNPESYPVNTVFFLSTQPPRYCITVTRFAPSVRREWGISEAVINAIADALNLHGLESVAPVHSTAERILEARRRRVNRRRGDSLHGKQDGNSNRQPSIAR